MQEDQEQKVQKITKKYQDQIKKLEEKIMVENMEKILEEHKQEMLNKDKEM